MCKKVFVLIGMLCVSVYVYAQQTGPVNNDDIIIDSSKWQGETEVLLGDYAINNGNISVTEINGNNFSAIRGNNTVNNGDILVTFRNNSPNFFYGIWGDNIVNNGSISIFGGSNSLYALYGHNITNNGDIYIESANNVLALYGSGNIINTGNITVLNPSIDSARTQDLIYFYSSNAEKSTIANYGNLTLISGDVGIYVRDDSLGIELYNYGGINLFDSPYGILINASKNAYIQNAGLITISHDTEAVAIRTRAQRNEIINTGEIFVTSPSDNSYHYARGIEIDSSTSATISNYGIINVSSPRSAFEVSGNNYTINDWATTLRAWSPTDAVFSGNSITFDNSTLILRPGSEADGFELGKSFSIQDMAYTSAGATPTLSGSIKEVKTEVPFLTATLTGNDPSTASVSVISNINENTVPGAISSVQTFTIAKSQEANIAKAVYQTKHSMQKQWSFAFNPFVLFTNNNGYDYKGTDYGATFAGTYTFNNDFSLGGHFDVRGSNNYADIFDMYTMNTNIALGAHGTYYIIPTWYVNGLVSGYISISNNDYVLNNNEKYTTDSDNTSGGAILTLNTGYEWELVENHSLTPELGLSYLNMNTGAYDILWDEPYSMYNMEYEADSHNALFANIKLHWKSEWSIYNEGSLMLHANVGLNQNIVGKKIKNMLTTLGQDFVTNSTVDTTNYTANIALEFFRDDSGISFGYNGDYSKNHTHHEGDISFKFNL